MWKLATKLGTLSRLSSVVRCGRCLSTTPPIVANLPPCDFVPQKYTGPSHDMLKQMREDHINPGMFTFYKNPVSIHQGHMQYLYDLDGNRYVDMFAGIATVIAGHCHPKIQEATFKQMEKLWHTSNIYYHPTIHEYAQKLTSTLPDPLNVCYFVNSGSEANDLALFMARLYTGCMDTLVFRGAYHGASPVTMGLTSLGSWYYNYPSATSIHKMRNPDPYKGPWGGKACRDSVVQPDRSCDCKPGKCEASDRYLDEVKDVLTYCTPKDKVGAFFAESIQGVNGAVQFPKGFVKRAVEAVRAKNGVCILDEVQTGFGRTGETFWGFQGHDVVPDIVVMAKGIGNGYPMAAVVTTKEISAVMTRALHFNTFGGNPVACATGSAVIDVIREDKLQENAHELGTHFLLELAKLRDVYEIVGDVRGKGFMIGVELVADKNTRVALPVDQVADIFEDLKDMRILCGKGGVFGNVMRFKPPMCVSKADVDYTVACFNQALANHRERQAK